MQVCLIFNNLLVSLFRLQQLYLRALLWIRPHKYCERAFCWYKTNFEFCFIYNSPYNW